MTIRGCGGQESGQVTIEEIVVGKSVGRYLIQGCSVQDCDEVTVKESTWQEC